MARIRRGNKRARATVCFGRSDKYVLGRTSYPNWDKKIRELGTDMCIPEQKIAEILQEVISAARSYDADLTLYNRAQKKLIAQIGAK